VNIILFSPSEVELPLPGNDSRARHIVTVLRRKAGDTFDAGVLNGPRGKGTIREIGSDGSVSLQFDWGEPPAPLAPIRLVVGLPRPQTARDILREGTALGVSAIDFVRTERSEPSYASSSLWASREWESLLVAGAAQAFCTRLPAVTHDRTLGEVIDRLDSSSMRLALDNYEAGGALGAVTIPRVAPVVVAVGSERGWTTAERALVIQSGFRLVHLGNRVLRVETACIAAISLIRAKLGLS
jgi:16S rRNA (uracil1498-N3)-methyltransferase